MHVYTADVVILSFYISIHEAGLLGLQDVAKRFVGLAMEADVLRGLHVLSGILASDGGVVWRLLG